MSEAFVALDEQSNAPEPFNTAVASMHAASLRDELAVSTIRPPRRLTPYSHAIGVEVEHPLPADGTIPVHSEGDTFGRLVLLYDHESEGTWQGDMRLVAFIQADVDHTMAEDQLMPEVVWSWLLEALEQREAEYSVLGGTVTATSSMRFGEIGGPPRAYQLELRASWTPDSTDLTRHVQAFGDVLAATAGLPAEGTVSLADLAARRNRP
ncbi:DUF3000 domain-containing protein [Corynebacterium choanae]